MKRKLPLVFFTCISCVFRVIAQDPTTTSSHASIGYTIKDINTNHEYIVAGNIEVYECNPVGKINPGSTALIAKIGYQFNIEAVNSATGDVAVKFYPFKTQPNAKNFNDKYFVIKKFDLDNSTKDNTDASKWVISYGALIIPFKFRPTKTLFTNNLNLGSSVYFQYQINKNFSHGVVAGISLSSVTLDSLSTNFKIKTNTDRPAFTPSLSYVISYKNISFTTGLGVDLINKTSVVEKSWIFNGKPWIGFGIGINLFNSGSVPANKTEPAVDQVKVDKKAN
jgi:hypothetical protein